MFDTQEIICRKKGSFRWLLPLLWMGVTLAGVAQARDHRKFSDELYQKTQSASGQNQMVDVIIQFSSNPTSRHFSKVSGLGGRLNRSFNTVRGGHFTLPVRVVERLANDPDVAYISPDRPIHLMSKDKSLQAIGADIAFNSGWTGTGVTVAVIDSGISSHPDLNDANGVSRVIYNESFVPGESAADFYGHGTHVAGIIAGSGFDSKNEDSGNAVKGVAPNVNLVNLKVLDKNGSGTDGQLIAA